MKHYGLSSRLEDNIAIALGESEYRIDLVECGDKLMHMKAIFGDIPLVASMSEHKSFFGYFRNLKDGIKDGINIMMQEVTLTTANEKKIKTVVSGISLIQSSRSGFFSQLSGIKLSARDSQVKMILVSPYSVIEYFRK